MSTKSSLSSLEQTSWPVRVFRCTPSKGWEESTCDDLAACPKPGCFEIPALRIRVRLLNDRKEPDALVVRRSNKIYWSHRGGPGGILLQFRSLEECLAFSDKLVSLNPQGIKSRENETADQQELESVKAEKRTEMMNYMMRLMHDEHFMTFVDEMEESISSTEDGARMLMAAALARTTKK